MQEVQQQPWHKYYQDDIFQLSLPEVSLYSLLADSAERYSEQTAITYNGETIDYRELKNRVDRLAGSWKAMNFQKGERIGLMMSNHPDYIISYYAAQALGLIVVQINPAYTTRELLQILDDANVSYVIVDNRSFGTIEEIKEIYKIREVMGSQLSEIKNGSLWHLEDLINVGSPLQTPVIVDPKEDVAVIQYTGGTTGKIKGAMLTHYNLTTNVYQSFTMYRQRIELGQETVLAATPLYHVYGMTSAMNLGLYIGANILLIKKFNTEEVLEKIKQYKPTMFPGVPKMYISFANHPRAHEYGLDSLKVCSSGSAPLPIEVIKRFEKISKSKILEGFGMSETSPTTHRTPIHGERKAGSIGIPVPGTDCLIIDRNNNVLGTSYVGELLIKGPQVMKGYWNNEAETKQALQNGWLYTGDLATMDEDGYFYIVGRKKEMIIFGGFNIYPQEIEGVLFEHEAVKEAAVVGLPHEIHGEIIKAYIVPKEGKEVDSEELRNYCYTKLTPYKVPKEIEVRESLPRNGVGKLLKRLLVKEEMERREQKHDKPVN
ncbi:long-chain fatty acid--CoA ligase [Bacillus sp. PK3_68]|uniref:long-chain-fatty-acid--CoA ligase n=1 Tax=Bacillus sp. PK3_68 TaxID=2027408 RepID=UPI000E747B3C|nr:long-chain fatty acid--CoA ligase [Bacillus sp. PK3_68]RJS50039.1 long-chain fatty acid--CoA ligase [Bacillus sp. PK3_68]